MRTLLRILPLSRPNAPIMLSNNNNCYSLLLFPVINNSTSACYYCEKKQLPIACQPGEPVSALDKDEEESALDKEAERIEMLKERIRVCKRFPFLLSVPE